MVVATGVGCATAPGPSDPGRTESDSAASLPEDPTRGSGPEKVLILISLDGFRWDFLNYGATPTLSRLAAEGVHAERLNPSFPTKTFPNHYTIVTGLRPSEHGLVANNVLDPWTGERFALANRKAVADGKWYGGEPIWVAAERAGIRTAPLFWPGSEAEILGVRPSYSRAFDGDLRPEDRVDLVLEWLDLPPTERPSFLTLYFEDVDEAAHTYGPAPSEKLSAALATVDGAVKRLLDGLTDRNLAPGVDLIIVSDHGMSETSSNRLVFLDDYVDVESANVVDWSPVLGLWPAPEDTDAVYEALAEAHPHLAIYRRAEIPARLQYSEHERIPPIVGVSDDGWSVTSRSYFKRCPKCFDGGTHGYDHRLESMGALLIANGPSFRRATKIGPIDNIHLYHVMCAVLGLEPAKNSGDPGYIDLFLDSPSSPSRHRSRPEVLE